MLLSESLQCSVYLSCIKINPYDNEIFFDFMYRRDAIGFPNTASDKFLLNEIGRELSKTITGHLKRIRKGFFGFFKETNQKKLHNAEKTECLLDFLQGAADLGKKYRIETVKELIGEKWDLLRAELEMKRCAEISRIRFEFDKLIDRASDGKPSEKTGEKLMEQRDEKIAEINRTFDDIVRSASVQPVSAADRNREDDRR